MAVPEYSQQFLKADYPGIVIQLHRFRMISHIPVGWRFFFTAGIAHTRSYHTVNDPEPGFYAPESAEAESSRFIARRRGLIQRRDAFRTSSSGGATGARSPRGIRAGRRSDRQRAVKPKR